MPRQLLIASLCASITGSLCAADPHTYYVAPGGDDAAAGSSDAPFASLTRLSEVMVPGDHAYIRGGIFRISRALVPAEEFEHLHYLAGTAAQGFLIENFPGEKPVFDFTGSTYVGGANGLGMIGSHHVHLKGLRFTNLAQMPDGAAANGIGITNSTDNVFENIEVDHIGGYGFAVGSGSNDNLFLNCDAHHIDDRYSGWDNANGFSITGSNGNDATGNVFDGCRAWFASDDGFDLFRCYGAVTMRNCWAFWNGYEDQAGTKVPRGDGMGFKLGPIVGRFPTTVKRVIEHNISFENKVGGFDENGNYDGQGIFHLYNNTSLRNGASGFISGEMSGVVHDVRNNVSFDDPVALADSSGPKPLSEYEWCGSSNSWNLAAPLSAADFLGLSTAGADGPRKADGSLPDLPLLRPSSASSRLHDHGSDVGLPYEGTAPDLGAYELSDAGHPSTSGNGAAPGRSSRRCGSGSALSLAVATMALALSFRRRGRSGQG